MNIWVVFDVVLLTILMIDNRNDYKDINIYFYKIKYETEYE